MTGLFFNPRVHPLDANGRTLAGAKLYFYETGTDTPISVYTDPGRTTAHAHPVVADGAGRFAAIFLPTADYDVVLKDSDGATIWTADGLPGESSAGDDTTGLGRQLTVGAMVWDSSNTTPTGWLRLRRDPQALLKSAYPELSARYAADGYPYGSTDTTFNIPGGAGLFPRIWDDVSTHDPDAANRTAHADGTTIVGNLIGSRQDSANLAHSHGPGTLTGTTDNPGNHSHTVNGVGNTAGVSGTGAVNVADDAGNITTTNAGSHTHVVTVDGGLTADSGTDESRPENIAFPIIILVSPSLAAADTHSTLGFPYVWDSGTTDADPGAGQLRVDNADILLATNLYISSVADNGADLDDVLSLTDLIGGVRRAIITIYNAGALNNSVAALVTGAVTDNGAYLTIPIDVRSVTGDFVDGDKLSFALALSGQNGNPGDLDFAFDVGTTDADPGAGNIRFNDVDWRASTEVYISKTGESGGDFEDAIARWDDSTSTIKGTLTVYAVSNRAIQITASVTGLTDATTYYKIALDYVAGSIAMPPDEASVAVQFAAKGDRGDTVGDHGTLTGLADDDHPQYHTDARGDARYYTQVQSDALYAPASSTIPSGGATGQVLKKLSASDYDFDWQDDANTGGGGGVTDHGALTGLTDDDHPQYHNDTRGDARYYTKAQSDGLITAHEAESDPHAQYLTLARLNAARPPTSATDYLAGEEGVAIDFVSRTAIINDYADVLSDSGRPPDLLTITRATTATYIGRDRLLKTAAVNELRYTHDPVTGEPRGALFEGAATNNLQRSKEFDNAYWSKSLATITTNAAVAPDGTTTMDKLVEDETTGTHQVASSSVSLAKDGTYCFSVWLKDDGIGQIRLVISAFSGHQVHVDFNLGALTATPVNSGNGANAAGGIIDYGGGLYRLWVSGVPNTAGGAGINCVIMMRRGGTSYLGDGASGVYIWGAQLETGSYPTSYIPTTTAAVTRNADAIDLAAADFALDADQGTLLWEGEVVSSAPSGTGDLISLTGTAGNSIAIREGTSISGIDAYVDESSVNQADTASTALTGEVMKAALAYTTDDLAFVVDGGTPATDAGLTVPTVTDLKITPATGHVLHVRSVAYFSRRMTNTEIQARTTI